LVRGSVLNQQRPKRRVLAVGELVTDHIFTFGADGPVYRGARGGGTIANIAAGMAAAGANDLVQMQGWVGDDVAGGLAVADLSAGGVDVQGVSGTRGRRTRLIFEHHAMRSPGGPSARVSGETHSFTTACTVCDQRLESNDTAAAPRTMKIGMDTNLLVLDRLGGVRTAVASQAAKSGMRLALDLGAVSYLRFQPVAQILASLRRFDVLAMNESVEGSLLRRAGLLDLSALVDVLRVPLVMVTRGKQGVDLLVAPRGQARRLLVPAPSCEITDDAGAGDALLSGVLARLTALGREEEQVWVEQAEEAVRASADAVATALGSIGARGHLAGLHPSDSPYGRYHGMTARGLLELSHQRGSCVLCELPVARDVRPDDSAVSARGSSLASTASPSSPTSGQAAPKVLRRTNVAARNVSLLLGRVMRVAEQLDATERAAEVLAVEGTCYVIGTGGSFASALSVAQTINGHGRSFAQAIRPLDYIRTAKRTDMAIAVSYSGGSQDLDAAMAHADALGVDHLVLLTSASTPRLARRLRPMRADMLIAYGPGPGSVPTRDVGVRERGFVSFAGTLMPCVPFMSAIFGAPALVDLVDQLDSESFSEGSRAWGLTEAAVARAMAEQSQTGLGLTVFAGGWALAACADLESKFIEGGLGDVQTHEPKDFAHGRFISVLGEAARSGRPSLLLSVGELSVYEQGLARRLRAAGVPTYVIKSRATESLGSFELLLRVQPFVLAYAEAEGTDIGRPKNIPRAGLDLYRWRGPLA
jgi:sugar/nucleoside kinase (ribokinase family)/fructoselysine-6-P-deglycase FrlB-like protein